MAEWSKALDSKASVRLAVTRVRIPFPPFFWAFLHWRGGRVVEGARLEIVYTRKVSWVRIPPSPLEGNIQVM